MHCVAGVQAVLAMAEPTCQALCYSGADCLSGVGTYLLVTVLQWGRPFKQCRNLPAVHCVTVVKAVKEVSEPTYRAPVLQGCRLFQQCQNLPAGHCVAGVQTV